MNWWMDLVWVGNVLYPRWFVLGILAFIVLSPFIVWGAFRLFWRVYG